MEKERSVSDEIRFRPIGIIFSCFTEKFGIPRQPGIVKKSSAILELYPPYNREETVRGLSGFSHIWVQFLFHQVVGEGWRPTVRPPRLGGKKRCGVFACRSPHRPNHLGLSAVCLEQVETGHKTVRLHLSGIDFLNETPVLDVKPYIPCSDSISNASNGFTAVPDGGGASIGKVLFSEEAATFCRQYEAQTNRPLQALITELVAADPRPRSQIVKKKEFGMLLWDVNFCWQIEEWGVLIIACYYQNL